MRKLTIAPNAGARADTVNVSRSKRSRNAETRPGSITQRLSPPVVCPANGLMLRTDTGSQAPDRDICPIACGVGGGVRPTHVHLLGYTSHGVPGNRCGPGIVRYPYFGTPW